MYTITTTKARTVHYTLSDALLASIAEPHASAAFGPTLTMPDGNDVSFELVDGDSISVDSAQDIARAAGVDPRDDDEDGLHWPYAPSMREFVYALSCKLN